MKTVMRATLLLASLGVAGCAVKSDDGLDVGFDSHKLDEMRANIWADPTGCHHWAISDGVEGYLTTRLSRDGKPVCPGRTTVSARLADIPRSEWDMGIWTDPRGCTHWIYDDGAEGYMSQRLDANGRPVCPGVSPPPPPPAAITLAAAALFDFDKANLRPEGVAELNEFGRKMRELGKQRTFVVGHTDSRGTEAYNLDLSKRRARAVADYLDNNFGIISQTDGRGESDPVAGNDTEEGRQENRRVVINILD